MEGEKGRESKPEGVNEVTMSKSERERERERERGGST